MADRINADITTYRDSGGLDEARTLLVPTWAGAGCLASLTSEISLGAAAASVCSVWVLVSYLEGHRMASNDGSITCTDRRPGRFS